MAAYLEECGGVQAELLAGIGSVIAHIQMVNANNAVIMDQSVVLPLAANQYISYCRQRATRLVHTRRKQKFRAVW